MNGRESFERGMRGLLAQHRVESTGEIQEVEVFGNLAYCWTKPTVRVFPRTGGSATSRAGSALSIFCKQSKGSWVPARDANLLTQVS
jgi:ketosteroid isomerase-like protein